MKPILVIGATGTIGRQVVTQLAARAAQVRAMARNPDAAHLPRQAEVVRADLTAPETLDGCLDGVDTVLLVWTAPRDTVEAAVERMARRARRIVFLSAPLKTPHPFFQQPNASRNLAEHIERTIEASGLEWTHLRPGMFAANSRHFWGPQIRAGDLVRWPYLEAPTAPIDERDIAAVAVRVLCEEGHGGLEYVITGPESLCQYEQVATIGRVMGRRLRIEEVPPEEWQTTMPAPVVRKLLDAWGAAVGQPAWVTSTVEEMTGRPARRFEEWVRNNMVEFWG